MTWAAAAPGRPVRARADEGDSTGPRGAALIDLVFACGLIAIVSAIALPALHATRQRDAARVAATYLASRMQAMRLEALRRNGETAIRFDASDLGRLDAYVDGDGDGVLQRDIDAGLDPPLAPTARLRDHFATVALRIAADIPDPEGGGMLAEGSDPVRIGSTNLLSFSPLGSATSGTIYIGGEDGSQTCVRILGSTGRMRVLRFDPSSRAWRQD